MGILDDIKKTQTPIKPVKGIIWINMLVEYDTNGHAKILQSFSNPAKESTIQRFTKTKKEEPKGLDIKEEVKKVDLF